MSARDRDGLRVEAEGGEPTAPGPKPTAGTTPAEKRYGSPLAQALADKGVTAPTAGDAAQAAVDKKSGGAPVDSGVRAAVEPHVGADLGGVRVHSDPLSQQSTAAMGARAFAHGGDVFLGPGESATDVGLMAHELTHVVQQGAAGEKGAQRKLEVGAANSPAEQQADAVAGAVVGGAAPQQLIVDDAAPVADGQMNRNAFLAALKPEVMKAAEEELGFVRAVIGCPYIEKYFAMYSQRDARTIESAARKFAPGARNAKNARDLIPPLVAQVREGVRAWMKDGSLIGPAAELDPAAAAAARSSHDEGPSPAGGSAQTKPIDGDRRAPVELEDDAARSAGVVDGALAKPAVDARSPAAIRDSLGDGQALDSGVASRMGDAMGENFADVRIHTDSNAARLARQEGATAFTVGTNVAFDSGQYQPGTPRGDALLAHELAHVAQQRGTTSADAHAKRAEATAESPAHEEDADRAATGVMGRLWGGVKSAGDRIGTAMRAPFQLSRCKGDDAAKTQAQAPAKQVPTEEALGFPMPITMVPFGDQFDIAFRADGARTLLVVCSYKGPHQAAAADPWSRGATTAEAIHTIKLKKDAPNLIFNPAIEKRTEAELWVDLFSDRTHLLVLRDKVTTDESDFNKRKHAFSVTVNGERIDGSVIDILLAEGVTPPMARGGPGDDRVSSQQLKLNGDEFELKARRFGDTNQVVLHLASASADKVTNANGLVPMKADIKSLGIKMLKNDGRTINLSLDQDKSSDVQLIHTVSAADDPDAGQRRIHYLRAFDADGILLHTFEALVLGNKVDIPEAQDESKNKPDTNKEWPANRPPAQEDTPGEVTTTIERSGGIFEMRIDGDGDRGKELLVRFKAGKLDKGELEVRVEMVQISSGALAGPHTFKFPISKLEPRLSSSANGDDNTAIWLDSSQTALLTIDKPVDSDDGRSYRVLDPAKGWFYTFPKETTPVNPLVQEDITDPKQVSPDTPKLGGVQFRNLTLGDYNDQFRFTLEQVSKDKVIFGIAGVNEGSGGGVAADGFAVNTPGTADRIVVEKGDPLAASFRINESPGSDIIVYDRMTTNIKEGGPPEVNRTHSLTVKGPQVPDQLMYMVFHVSKNRFSSSFNMDGPERDATTAALAVGGLARQGAAGSLDHSFAITVQKAREVREFAHKEGLISDEMHANYTTLLDSMNELDPMTDKAAMDTATAAQDERRGALRAKAADAADAVISELTALTIGSGSSANEHESRVNGGGGGFGFKSDYLGGRRSRFGSPTKYEGGISGLGTVIRDGKWPKAYEQFEELRKGFDKYLAKKLEKDHPDKAGELKYYGALERQLASVMEQGDGTEEGKPRRISAVFVPNSTKSIPADQPQEHFQGGVPMHMYVWRSGGRWWLRDVTNPNTKHDEDVDAAGHAVPPHELFKKLNWDEHFPDGIIHYHDRVEGGNQNRVVVDDSKWDFWDWLKAIGFGIAAVGIALATAGYGVPALVAFALSGAAGIAVSVHNLIEKGDHNALDATTWVIEIANIISSAMVVAGSVSKILVNSARAASIRGAAWTGGWAKWAGVANKAFVPIVGAGVVADVTTVVAMTDEMLKQLAAIDAAGGSESARNQAKAHVIAGWLATGALTVIAIKGDLPVLRGKAPPNLVIDFIDGKAIAHAGGVRIGGGGPEHEIHVDPKDPDAHAGARWQSHQLEDAAKVADGADPTPQQKAAKELLDDEKFMEWYRRWMSQAEKVEFVDGNARVKMPKNEAGLEPPDDIKKKLQDFVDKAGIGLYEKGFKNADELRKIEKAVKDAGGGDMNLDPTHPDWGKHRPKVVEALGGDADAEAMLKRYETARGGAFADPAKYAAERAHLNELVPDTELDRIRKLFDGYEVYVTGSATQTGKKLKGSIEDLDVFVVVPADTTPDMMQAIERRIDGFKVRPDPRFIKAHNLPDGHTIGLDVKVMTPEQFFGMATAKPGIDPVTKKPRTPLAFHSLDHHMGNLTAAEQDIVAKATAAVAKGEEPNPADMAKIRRMIGLGDLDPKLLPDSMKSKLPSKAGIDEEAARAWANDLANSNPNKMTDEEIKADLDAYKERKKIVAALYEKAKANPDMELPGGITFEQLELAVKGGKDGVRVPLTFSVNKGALGHDVEAARKLFDEFQAELKAVFAKHGITDAVVVQLGSGTTGWSTAPGKYEAPDGTMKDKVGKPWKPTSDTDFAIFSDQALVQAMEKGAIINPKNKQAGLFTTVKNRGEKPGEMGFADTPLGADLDKLAKEWDLKIYGKPVKDGFDFKLNLDSSAPFKSAVPVLQLANPQAIPVHPAKTPGHTAAVEIPGREGPYFGVQVQDPRVILPPDAPSRQEYHVTVLTPPELAALPADKRAKIQNGAEIPGSPKGGEVVNKPIDDHPGYQLKVEWPEAQKFREELGLGPKDFHVTLNGGIGDAIRARDAAKQAVPDGQK